MKRSASIAAVLLCLLLCPGKVRARQPCHLPVEEIRGIWILESPNGLRLGSREIRPGDVLTAAQAEKLTWEPGDSALAAWLPVGETGPAARETLILGRRNLAPIAEDTALETYRNLSARKKLPVQEPEGEPLVLTLGAPPKRGTVRLHPDGSCTYTPYKNKIGPDYFTYRAADPQGNLSREARVTVTILKPSEAPQFRDTLGKDWAVPAQWLLDRGIWQDQPFQPEAEVTRGEFLTALLQLLDLPKEDPVLPEKLQGLPQWFQPYASAALRSGLFTPLSGPDTFDPEIPITRHQAQAMVDRALDRPTEEAADTSSALTREQAACLLWDSFSGQ